MNKIFAFLYSLCVVILIVACQSNTPPKIDQVYSPEAVEQKKNLKYGFDLDLHKVVKKKIRRGDTFGSILENHGIDYPEVYNILQAIKRDVDVKRLVTGKTYQLIGGCSSMTTAEILLLM